MSWKKSKDGGLDFDVKTELKYRKVIKEMDERHNDASEKFFNKYYGRNYIFLEDLHKNLKFD